MDLLSIFFIIIGILAIIYATLCDISILEIPNTFTAALAILIITIVSVLRLFGSNQYLFSQTLLVMGLALVAGLILWIVGYWGGGDLKIFPSLVATLPDPFQSFFYFTISIIFFGFIYKWGWIILIKTEYVKEPQGFPLMPVIAFCYLLILSLNLGGII